MVVRTSTINYNTLPQLLGDLIVSFDVIHVCRIEGAWKYRNTPDLPNYTKLHIVVQNYTFKTLIY